MYFARLSLLFFVASFVLGCGEPAAPLEPPLCERPSAPATCLKPTMEPAYYVEQAEMYFDTLDADAPIDSIPTYAPQVARWEWPPWLKLTGIGRTMLIASDIVVTRFATPSTVPTRDCRFFEEQPFARCRVVFSYSGGDCPIYEEFTFNDAGEMTFIEAWSDLPGYLPMDAAADAWAEGEGVDRLSTRVPGLGTPDGSLQLEAEWMREAARKDDDLADFVVRAKNFWPTWTAELANHDLTEEGIYGEGCGW